MLPHSVLGVTKGHLTPEGGGGALHIKFAQMCVLRIKKYTHIEGLLKN